MQKILESKDIVLEAWSPLAAARFDIFLNPLLVKLSVKYKKTTAQIALRYLYQRGMIILPRSKNEGRIKENIDIVDFNIDDEDMNKIDSLNQDRSVFG